MDAQHTRICLLTMCGIFQGPFVHLKGSIASSYIHYFETGAARELFQFQSSDTPISQAQQSAYRRLLAAGVKCVHVGSVDDNVVPLYSALYSSAAHPSILRAVYVDEAVYTRQDFLIQLIVLCVAVRNCGFHDHNLLTLLSASVAGSLYTGAGHSLLYDEPAVYSLATRYLLETYSPRTSGAQDIPLVTMPHAPQRWNPYELPWGLRGLLEDDVIRHFYAKDIRAVIRAFAAWQPMTKPLKELQWRMSPMGRVQVPTSEPDQQDQETNTALDYDDGEAVDTLHPSVVPAVSRTAKL